MAAAEAPRFDLRRFLPDATGPRYVSEDAHALVAVVRLAQPVSFDRDRQASVTTDAGRGVAARGPDQGVLLLADDVIEVQVDRQKTDHVKNASVILRGSGPRALREILPGDWALVWLVPARDLLDDLVARVRRGDPCNHPEDGLRLFGRVHQVRERLQVLPDGRKEVATSLQLVGFGELDAQLYYDYAIATNDVMQQSVGRWLTRVGVDADALFGRRAADDKADNVNKLIPEILDLVLGRGASKDVNAGSGAGLSAAAGAGAGDDAPNAYVVPALVGRLLGRDARRSGGAVAYADLLDLLIGVQTYRAKEDDLAAHVPNLDDATKDTTRRRTATPLSGSFLPQFPQMVNTPFWNVLSHFLNDAVNEMYTCLRVTPDGTVAPTLVVRQIPFTSLAFDAARVDGRVTRFLNLPRWVVPSEWVTNSDLGRSDSTRCNLVHVYGSANEFANNMSVSKQLAEAPPIRDDLDVQRSGPRPYVRTVECAPEDQRGSAGKWMSLIADWTMGSQLTLNGTFETVGLPGPVAEGDNLEVDGLVYQIEGLTDVYSVEGGRRRWRTIVRASNGVLATGDSKLRYLGVEDRDARALDAAKPAEFAVRRTADLDRRRR